MRGLMSSPARQRLEWILAGLGGAPGWGSDIGDVLSPAFVEAIAPRDYREIIRLRAVSFAPLVVTRVDVGEVQASARIRDLDGRIQVLACVVEPEPPHRITSTWLQPEIPTDLTPRLPMDFPAVDARPGPGSALVVFAGVPGSGKSTLAEAVGSRLRVPVFAFDWLLGALTPFGGRNYDHLVEIGYEQLTTLAYRQMSVGQSVIIDAPVEDIAVRQRWAGLARSTGAVAHYFVCRCPDAAEHRRRLESRDRGIPGWHQGGDWDDVSRRLLAFPPWPDAVALDTTSAPEDNLALVLDRLRPVARSASNGER